MSETYRRYLRENTVYQNLINLKSHVALNTSSYKIALRNKYHLLIKSPKGNEVAEWLARYERFYSDMQQLNLPEVQGDNPIWDFVNAAENIDSNWATSMRLQLSLLVDQNKSFDKDLFALIQNLRTFKYSLQVAHGQTSMTTAFQASL